MSLGPDEEFCSSCGEAVKKAAVLCPNCGVHSDRSGSGSSTDVYCNSCGESIKQAAELCPNCGVRQQHSSDGNSGLDAEVVQYVQIVFGSLFLLAALGSLTDFSDGVVSSVALFMIYAVIGLVLLPPVREQLEMRYPLTTFGWREATRTSNTGVAGESCSVCAEPIESGVRRRFGKDLVLFGVVLWFDEQGANKYCSHCLETDAELTQQVSLSSEDA